MSLIAPQKKNLRSCTCCQATYVINQDPSGFWCEWSAGYPLEGVCEFCDPANKVWYNHKLNHWYESCRINTQSL